ENFAPAARGIDYMHLDASSLNLEAKDFSYSPETISADVENFTVTEKSGVAIEEFNGRLFYGPKGAELRDFHLETPRTLLRDDIVVRYPSIESLTEDIGKLSIDANLQESHVSFQDILLFAPQLANTPPFKGNPNE